LASIGQYGQWRGHSATWIVDRLVELQARGAQSVQIVDDQFIGPPPSIARAFELVSRMRERSLVIPFQIMVRADTVLENAELFGALRTVGLDVVFLGLESGDQTVLGSAAQGVARRGRACAPSRSSTPWTSRRPAGRSCFTPG